MAQQHTNQIDEKTREFNSFRLIYLCDIVQVKMSLRMHGMKMNGKEFIDLMLVIQFLSMLTESQKPLHRNLSLYSFIQILFIYINLYEFRMRMRIRMKTN